MRLRFSARRTGTAALAGAWLAVLVGPALHPAAQDARSVTVARPVISAAVSPVETITPVARDGHRGLGLLRKPPGPGPFPGVVVIHGGLVTHPRERLEEMLARPMPSRLLAAGYVIAVMTYRSRDADPQSQAPVADALAAVEYLRQRPYVDPKSVAIYGCSGGGDLALQVAAATDVAAIAPEEPASVLLTGVLNKNVPKLGERHDPVDAAPLMADPRRFYTADFHKFTRDKIGTVRTPILIVQGDELNLENRFNRFVLIPELKAAGKSVEVLTYPGEPHCFLLGADAPHPAVALEAFEDVDAFFRRQLPTRPRAVDPSLVTGVPVTAGQERVTLAMVITPLGSTSTSFAGKWRTNFPGSGVMELVADGNRLTGSVGGGRGGSAGIHDGKIDGSRISFAVKSPAGDRTITFDGRLNGDEIVFTREVQMAPDGRPGGPGILGGLGQRAFVASRVR